MTNIDIAESNIFTIIICFFFLFPVLPPILFSSFSPLLLLFFLFFLPFFSLHPVAAVLSSLCTHHHHQLTRTCAAAHHHQYGHSPNLGTQFQITASTSIHQSQQAIFSITSSSESINESPPCESATGQPVP